MSAVPRLRDKYVWARCCVPTPPDPIVGYFSHDDVIKVHRRECPNLAKAETDRLLDLEWGEITLPDEPVPDTPPGEADQLDVLILRHHQRFDIDYSLMVAKALHIDRQDAFARHQKLRNLGLLERVDALMVRYRKNTAQHKWIKHRNHTYYRLTEKGARYLALRAEPEASPDAEGLKL